MNLDWLPVIMEATWMVSEETVSECLPTGDFLRSTFKPWNFVFRQLETMLQCFDSQLRGSLMCVAYLYWQVTHVRLSGAGFNCLYCNL